MVLSEWGRYKMVLWVGEIQDGTVLVEEIQYGTVWVGGDTRWYCLSGGDTRWYYLSGGDTRWYCLCGGNTAGWYYRVGGGGIQDGTIGQGEDTGWCCLEGWGGEYRMVLSKGVRYMVVLGVGEYRFVLFEWGRYSVCDMIWVEYLRGFRNQNKGLKLQGSFINSAYE